MKSITAWKTVKRFANGLIVVGILSAIAILSISCETAAPQSPVPGWTELRGLTFAMWRPKEILVGREPVTDFNYFYMYEPRGDDQKPWTLYVYEGYSPKSFYRTKDKLAVTRSGAVRIGAFQGMEAAGTDANGNYWRELHLRQSEQTATVHIWYFDVPKEQSAKFDSIIRTIQVRERR